MERILLAILACLPVFDETKKLPALPPPAQPDICGIYLATGKDSNDNEYECVVKVSRHLATYRVEWAFAGAPILGGGMLDGKEFTIGWKMPVITPGGDSILAGGCHKMIFDASRNKASGKWCVFPGPGKIMVEKWELLKGEK